MLRRLRSFRALLLLFAALLAFALAAETFVSFAFGNSLPPTSPLQAQRPVIQQGALRGAALADPSPGQQQPDQPPGNCATSAPAAQVLHEQFGWNANVLNPKYRNTTLCEDTLLATPTSICEPATQLFLRFGWPADLLISQDTNQVACTQAHQPPTQPPTVTGCAVNTWFGTLDPCQMVGNIWGGFVDGFNHMVNWVITQAQHFTQRIPPDITYRNPAVIAVWKIMVICVDALIGTAILWTGFRWLTSGANALEYATVIDVLPRLFLTVLLVHFSLYLAQFVIDLNNAFCDVLVNHVGWSPVDLAHPGPHVPGYFVVFMQLLGGTLNVLLVLQAAVQLAAIAFAIALAPVCLFCLFHPDTQRIGRLWVSAFSALCFMRFLQVLAITVGSRMLGSGVLNSMPGTELLNLVIGVGVLIVAFMIPGVLRHWILMPISGGSAAISAVASFVMLRFASMRSSAGSSGGTSASSGGA